MQLFVVSNRTETWYFTNNNTRHFTFNAEERFLPIYQFTAEDNAKITHLDDFADAFLAKCTLGDMISREQKLLMMRPYQIYAVDRIVKCIEENSGNGYIWHTTGSGKTLTSFKASTLPKDNPDIHKCLFVVDRKDLDRQTREEFNRFQEGCVEEDTNTATLVRRLLSDDYSDKVIVTTIQKLGLALDEQSRRNRNREQRGRDKYSDMLAPLRDKRMAIIFDECHRSQFGDTHQTIKAFFPKAQLFGFTGTPIFEQNATVKQIDGEVQTLKTTKDVFQQELHAYTITHAIEDRNVLRFHVDYFKPDGENPPKPGDTLTKRAVVDAILDKHDAATAGRRFNALLATSSINDAIAYYELFKKVQAERQAENPDFEPLKVAAVFSPPADGNADVRQLQEDLPQEKADNATEPDKKKAALKRIMDDYNASYGTNHSTDGRIRKYSDEEFCIAASNDVLMVLSDLPNGRALAKCFLVDEDEKYAVNQRVCRLTPTDVRSNFFYYALNRHWWLLALDDGLTQTHLSKGNVLDCPLAIPSRKSEQRRVTDCLASLDAMIAAQAQKLDALRTHKRGLMQQLFPSPEDAEA